MQDISNKKGWLFAALILSAALIILQLALIVNQSWSGDYWEHRAVIHELMQHGIYAKHPILKLNVPHQFFSPYAFLLASVANLFHISSKSILDFAAIANLIFFFTAVYLLVILFLDNYNNRYKAFTLLLCSVLFFNGTMAPLYSGYFHIKILLFVTSYPSTFCFNCAVLSAYLFRQALMPSCRWRVLFYAAQLFLLWMILLTHPLTFIVVGILKITVFINAVQFNKIVTAGQIIKAVSVSLLLVVFSFIVASLWPLYPFYSLMKYVNPGNEFHLSSLELYVHPFHQFYPFILIIPLCFFKFNSLRKDAALPVAFILCIIIAAYGFISGSYGFGRIISLLLILGSVFCVKYFLELKTQKQKFFIGLLWLLLAVPYTHSAVKHLYKIAPVTHDEYVRRKAPQSFSFTSHQMRFHKLYFLRAYLIKEEVVLAERSISLFLPAMGVKVVATYYPTYWIKDISQRQEAAEQFFKPSATNTQRKQILQQYEVNYVLLTPDSKEIEFQIKPLVDSSFRVSQNGITLLKIAHSRL
jgi:hypothetical protein